MPIWVASLIGGLIEAAGSIVGKVLLSAGIGYVAFTGVDAAFEFVKSEFLAGVQGLPADAIAMAGVLQVGVCVSMLLSAVAARAALMGLQSGTIKKMVVK